MGDISISSSATLIALGAFHGINPGMGWLFAVALGMQERRRGAVIRALLPLGIGHVLAVAAAIAATLALGTVIPPDALRWPVAALLVTLGVMRLFRHRHPRWASMRVSMRGLTWWSFLMATAHGAGLMVVPVFLNMTVVRAETHACHTAAAHHELLPALVATGLHGAGYLAVTAVAAVVVFEKLGVGMLRKAWFNIDLLWAAALIVTGGLTLLL